LQREPARHPGGETDGKGELALRLGQADPRELPGAGFALAPARLDGA